MNELSERLKTEDWLGFSPGTSEEAARRRFVERYRQDPEIVTPAKNMLVAGPVPVSTSEREGVYEQTELFQV